MVVAGRLSERVTTTSLAKVLSRTTVPVAVLPPRIVLGVTLTDWMLGGLTVSAAVFVTLPRVAVTVPLWLASTMSVWIVKVALTAPAGIVTLGGVVADARLSESVT